MLLPVRGQLPLIGILLTYIGTSQHKVTDFETFRHDLLIELSRHPLLYYGFLKGHLTSYFFHEIEIFADFLLVYFRGV